VGPWSDANRTISERFKDFSSQKPDFCLIDEAPFEFVSGPNGKKIMLSPEEALAIRARRIKSPRPPKIQQDLLEARQLRERLAMLPSLSYRGPISKRSLRSIAVISDAECQKREFEGLMNGARRPPP